MTGTEGQSAANEDEGAVKQSNRVGTPDSAKAQGQSARKKEKPDLPDNWWSDSGFAFRFLFGWVYALETLYYCLRNYEIEVKVWKEQNA